MTKQKLAAGARLRTEIVTARLNPKIKYGLDLLARLHRRSIAQTVEWAIWLVIAGKNQPVANSLADIDVLLQALWSPSPSERLQRLAEQRPDLMTYEDELLWRAICRQPAYWQVPGASAAAPGQNFSLVAGAQLLPDKVDAQWAVLQNVILATPGSRGPRTRQRKPRAASSTTQP